MKDKELYRQLLGLPEPWVVSEVNIDFDELSVEVNVEWPRRTKAACPECGNQCSVYDRRDRRKWRHLDTMQFRTVLVCEMPRVNCPEHGVKTVEAPWADDHSRFTALFERLAIDVMLAASSQAKAKKLLALSWDEVHRIQERAVKRGLERRGDEPIDYIGVDEKSFLRGQSYVTCLFDLDKSRVLEVTRDRKESSLKEALDGMSDDQRQSVQAVAMDMWAPYVNAAEELMPKADIVHDKFHIAKFLNEAVDKVRREEHKALKGQDSGILAGTKYLWLVNPDNWTADQKTSFKELKDADLKVSRAWAIKETFSNFWSYSYVKSAIKFFRKWFFWATHSRLKPVIKAAKTIERHLDRIITYLKHRITNAVAEGINSKIQQIKAAARGFRNFENYRIAILFHCGKLSMYPQKCQ